jgi:ABC-type ATPase involved in cell division
MPGTGNRDPGPPIAREALRPASVVESDGVARHYGSVIALEDLSFSVGAGEILGVLGPNGAGKTTAIRVLTTILAPTRGRFIIAGMPHTRPAQIRRVVGVLPESSGYPERRTGLEHLRYYARLYGHGRASARAAAQALLDQVGLSDRGRSLIGTYSRGMRQRLGIARALINDPAMERGNEAWPRSTAAEPTSSTSPNRRPWEPRCAARARSIHLSGRGRSAARRCSIAALTACSRTARCRAGQGSMSATRRPRNPDS